MNPLLLLRFVPPGAWWGCAILVAIGAVYSGHVIDVRAHEKTARAAGRAEVQAVFDKYRADAAESALEEESRRTQAMKEVNHESQRMAERARADAAVASSAADGLRNAVAVVAGGGLSINPTAAAVCPAAAALRDVLDDSIEALRSLAAEADESRNAGLSCERAYESLTP